MEESEAYIQAIYVPEKETLVENATVKTRCIIVVNKDYIIPTGTEMRGVISNFEFEFRVGLKYYTVDRSFVWRMDRDEAKPYRTIDQLKKDNSRDRAERTE